MKVTLTFELDHDEVVMIGEAVDMRRRLAQIQIGSNFGTRCLEEDLAAAEGCSMKIVEAFYSDIGKAIITSKAFESIQ